MDRILPGATYRVKETGELLVMRGQHNSGTRVYQAYAGLEPLKSHEKLLNKKSRTLESKGLKDSPEYQELQDQIVKIKSAYPEDKDMAAGKLKLVKQNSGLVYVQKNIPFPV